MDKRKGYVLLLINAGVRSSISERKKSRRLLHHRSYIIAAIKTIALLFIPKNKIKNVNINHVCNTSKGEPDGKPSYYLSNMSSAQ